jgi:hypothetical protein
MADAAVDGECSVLTGVVGSRGGRENNPLSPFSGGK